MTSIPLENTQESFNASENIQANVDKSEGIRDSIHKEDGENEIFEEPIENESFWSKTTWIQIGYGIWANQVMYALGLTYGFSSVTMPQLRNPAEPFRATLDEQAWITSSLLLTAPLGCLISGFALDKFGRRLMLVLCQVPFVISWLYIGFAGSAFHMIMGRLIGGIGAGMSPSPPRVYCTEMALPYIRGVIGVFPTVALASGITTQSMLGLFHVHWTWLCYIGAIYSTFLMMLNFFLPESPYYALMSKDNVLKTRSILKRIRAKNYNIDQEIYEMNEFKESNNLRKLPLMVLIKQEIFKPYACKPFCVIVVYIIFGSIVGLNIILFWSVDILSLCKVSIDPYLGSSILGTTRIVAACFASMIMFWAPRRPVAIWTAFVLGVLCISLGTYVAYTEERSIVPQIAFIMYTFIASLGYYPLPFLMLFELIPLQIRGVLGGVTLALSFLVMFFTNRVFPYVREALGIAGVLVTFGINSLLACVYLYIFLPETKGLSLQEIEEYYKGKRAKLERSTRVPAQSRLEHRQTLKLHKKDMANAQLSTQTGASDERVIKINF